MCAHFNVGPHGISNRRKLVRPAGFQREPFPPGNSHLAPTGAAKSGASDAANQAVDAELLEVVDAWPELPAALKSGILSMVRAARGG